MPAATPVGGLIANSFFEVIKYIQIGVSNKNGTPVSREVKAAADMTAATGNPVDFYPLQSKKISLVNEYSSTLRIPDGQ